MNTKPKEVQQGQILMTGHELNQLQEIRETLGAAIADAMMDELKFHATQKRCAIRIVRSF